REPGQADLVPDPDAGLLLEGQPAEPGPPGGRRVPAFVAVRGPQQARVAARRGADVPRAVLLRERDLEAAASELTRDRSAADARTDDERRAHVCCVTVSERTSGRW